MTPIVVALPGNEQLAARLADRTGAEIGACEFRKFPDEETYARIGFDAAGRSVALVATLDRPDSKFLPLVFTAATLRELGTRRVGLIAPYLGYMRQDRRFHAGEAVTAPIFARQLSAVADWLVTVDPHLHRIAALTEVYTVPARVVHAAPLLSRWIASEVRQPLLIGPDQESAQWVSAVADAAGAPFIVLEKRRLGDRKVEISVPDLSAWQNHRPVLIDDIISTGRTMIETLGHLKRAGMKPALCAGVHAVFAAGAYDGLRAAGAAGIVTANTIAHESNAIDVSEAIADAVRPLL